MGKYILKRSAIMLVTLFAVATLTFFMMHAIPGGPFSTLQNVDPAVKAAIAEKYNLNDPTWKQYVDYMLGLTRGDMGPSLKYMGMPVIDLIKTGIPASGQLGLIAIVVVVCMGVPLGVLAALKHGRWLDGVLMGVATVGVTIPSYILATICIYFFAFRLQVLPSFGLETGKSYILPVIALSAYSIAFITRLMRSSLLEVMSQDYIRTARAKGLPEFKVVARHALRNAVLPVVTVLGPLLAGLVSGSFALERIFAIPGLGKHFVDSISNRDYPVIMGVTLFYAVFFVVMVFIVDMLYGLIDPRIKLN